MRIGSSSASSKHLDPARAGPVESAAATMDDASIFLFDLQGYIVIRGVLSPEQVLAANRSTGALG